MSQDTITQRPSLTIVRRIKVPPAKIYDAWTRPDLIVRWFGPDAGPVLSAKIDLRVGGCFRVVFQTLDGETHDCSGEYREVEADRKLIFTWQWASTPERQSLVNIQLRPIPEGTELTFTHSQFFDEAARDRHTFGWNGSFNKLEAMLEAMQ
jgi:uncharacterized protein YndB with AHSA1/START domain